MQRRRSRVTANYTGTSLNTTALNLAAAPNGDCPIIANDILDAQGSAGSVWELIHYDSRSNDQTLDERCQL